MQKVALQHSDCRRGIREKYTNPALGMNIDDVTRRLPARKDSA
jgi:hypothetical protein